MKNFCELSVDGLKSFCRWVVCRWMKIVDSMVKLAGYVEGNGMGRGGRNVIGERKR